jgi:hypothetical protein
MKTLRSQLLILMLCMVGLLSSGYAQLTPSADSYTNAADPTTNYGAKTLLDVESASQTTYVRFDLSSIPTEYGSANITKATLKLYVNSVTAAGSFNVDYVNGTWAENTITADLAPALGTTIAASVPLTTADKNQYILIDITAAVQAWLSGTTNDGIALVGNSPVNATFDSKESTSTSHAAELDIVFAGGGGGGIAGITTATGSGLIGGGTGGTLNLSLTHTCATNQILQWSGSAWACASPTGSGTVTSVASGAGLTGGPITGSGTLSIATAGVSNAMLSNPSLTISPGTALTGGGAVALGGSTTLSLDTTKVPLLTGANAFSNNQTLNGTLTASSSGNTIVATTTNASVPAVEGVGQSDGVLGYAGVGSGTSYGMVGEAASSSGIGVAGFALATSGTNYGVLGQSTSPGGFGVHGTSQNVGVYGFGTNTGVSGTGKGSSQLGEILGPNGVWGVWGDTVGGSGPSSGVLGTAANNYAGYFTNQGTTSATIFIKNADTSVGDEVFNAYMADVQTSAIIGDPGCSGNGLFFIALQLGQDGMSNCSNYTLIGGTNGHTYLNAVFGSAVHLRVSNVDQLVATNANVDIIGTLSKGAGSFKIDHPLDPGNKYLYHSFVESPDMKNMYDGNITTNDAGLATVTLPNWFETLNRDFRYQLTVIGQFAQAIVASEISGNQFSIRTDKPNVKVSWQVTGTRQDAFANAHRIQVEVEKAPADRGRYLYPELVGAPETARIGYMAPAPGIEKMFDSRPAVPGGQAASEQRTPLHVPVLSPMPHPSTGKLTVNQK